MTARSRFTGDRGATIVEAAFILPVIFLVIMAIFEFGLIFRDTLTATDAVNDAARTGSVRGKNVVDSKTADFSIMEDLREGTNAIPTEWIDRIVIYRAAAPGSAEPVSQIPQSCKTGNDPAAWDARNCNVYDPQDAFYAVQQGDTDYFQCLGGVGLACGWDPENRIDNPLTPAAIENVGVYIRLDREQITKMFGDTWRIEDAAVARIEPGAVQP